MQLAVTFDPDDYLVNIFIGERGLSSIDDQRLRHAVMELLEKEPGLVTDWGSEGRMMMVSCHPDNAGKLLASMHMALEYGTTARVLTAETWCALKEHDEGQVAFNEYTHIVGYFGTDEERAALYRD